MTASSRPFLLLFGGIIAVVLASGVALAVAVHHAGMIEIDVHESGADGCDISGLRIPAFVLTAAMPFVPEHVFGTASAHTRAFGEEHGQNLAAVAKAMDELAKYPDFVLTEVTSRSEHVTITTRRGDLVIDVNSPDETVHVKVPMRAIKAVLSKLDRCG
jgi:hypothetical protein